MLKHAVWLLALASIAVSAQDNPTARPKELDALGFLAGNWTLKADAMRPDGTTEVTTGVMAGKWIVGKRHLEMIQSQKVMGMEMEGALIVSWDEHKNQYVTSWFDSMSGRPMNGWGDMKGNVLTTTTELYDMGPEMGGKMRIKMVLTKNTNDTFSMHVSGGDGSDWMTFFKADFTRKR